MKYVEESMRNLIFVINKNKLPELTKLLEQTRKDSETYDKATSSYAAITKLLRDDLLNEKEGVSESNIQQVFNACYYEAEDNDVAPKVNEENEQQPVTIEENNSNNSFINNSIQTIWDDYEKGKLQCWHFNAWDPEKQRESLEKRENTGNALLSLFEYNEDWRTTRLKQIKKGDIIFLFNRGGNGYVGMYRATGTVVVSPKDKGFLLEDTLKDIKEKAVSIDEAELYDIYDELRGGATSVASIRVEPEITNMSRSYNPINVIRQTIARVNENNTWELLHNFDKMKTNN